MMDDSCQTFSWKALQMGCELENFLTSHCSWVLLEMKLLLHCMVRGDIIDLTTGGKRQVSCRELFRNFNITLTRYTKGVYYTGIKLFSSIPQTIRCLNHTSTKRYLSSHSYSVQGFTTNDNSKSFETCKRMLQWFHEELFFNVTLSIYIYFDSITVF